MSDDYTESDRCGLVAGAWARAQFVLDYYYDIGISDATINLQKLANQKTGH